MVHLPNVTLICNTWYKMPESILAIQKTLEQITPAEVVFVSAIHVELPFNARIYPTVKMSYERQSEWFIKEYYKIFNTSHALNIHWDGYVLNGDFWDDEWLKLDYLGARWDREHEYTVGNGACCLKSKRFCETIANAEFIKNFHPDDEQVCVHYRPILEKEYGMKYGTKEQADRFSFEQVAPKQKTFGFHNYLHKPFA